MDFLNWFDLKLNKLDINFEKLYGLGGAFLVSPLSESKTFSKEMFSDDQKMFASAAYDYAIKRMRPVKDQLQNLNKDLEDKSLEENKIQESAKSQLEVS